MDLLQIREHEIFDALRSVSDYEFVLIGGYAVNAYTLPRFSVDCDVVVRNRAEFDKIRRVITGLKFDKISIDKKDTRFDGFERYGKEISDNFKVSLDILIGEILDRQTNARISADWIFSNSERRRLSGKTVSDSLVVRVVNPDALFVMKMLSCRKTDIRDLFLLVNFVKDMDWIRREIGLRYDFNNRLRRVEKEIGSSDFRNGLQGVFGLVDGKLFERNKRLIQELGEQK